MNFEIGDLSQKVKKLQSSNNQQQIGYLLKRDQEVSAIRVHKAVDRYIAIADKSMSFSLEENSSKYPEPEEDSEDEEEKEEYSSGSSSLISRESSVQDASRDSSASSALVRESFPNRRLSVSNVKLKITHKNFKLILMILSALKQKSSDSLVVQFADKIVSNLENTHYVGLSTAHKEKLEHMFLYKLFKYISEAFKIEKHDEVRLGSVSSSDSAVAGLDQIKTSLTQNIKNNLVKRVREVLDDPKSNAGSVGYVAGVSTLVPYLSESVSEMIVSSVSDAIKSKREYIYDLLPLIIAVLKIYPSKFSKDLTNTLLKLSISQTKKGKKRSKSLYLSLQLLLSNLKGDSASFDKKFGDINPKAFLKSKPLAKIFIRFFIESYYSEEATESQRKEGQAMLSTLEESLKENSKSSSDESKKQILNYIYSEILCYCMITTGFIKDDIRIGSTIHEQVNFFLRVYVKSCGYLSQVSPVSLCAYLSLILAESRNSDLFQGDPREHEKEMVNLLYYSALISNSPDFIDLIFGELEYISRALLDHGLPLTLISNVISNHNSQMFGNSLSIKDSDTQIKNEVIVFESESDGAIMLNSNKNNPKFCISILNFLSNIMGHIVKSDYSLYESGGGHQNLQMASRQIRCIFIPIVEFVYSSIFSNNLINEIDPSLKRLYTKIIRNIWGYIIIFRGLSEKLISFEELFDPDCYSSLELMSLAYLITPPLISEHSSTEPNALLEPEFPPEIVKILSSDLESYFKKKYSKQKKMFEKLPEDLLILLGEIELVYSHQLVYLNTVSIDDSLSGQPLPHLIEDIFYYLKHDDIIALPDMVCIITAQAHNFLELYFQIVLEKEKASSFIRDIISKSLSVFIENLCYGNKYVSNIIDEYPYIFLWKSVLLSYKTSIDQLAHLKYLEYGTIPEVSHSLRAAFDSNKTTDPFKELMKQLKLLTLFALICNHSHFKMIVKNIEIESKREKLFQNISLESNVNNFTLNLIKKWISEYSPKHDEYKQRIDMIINPKQSASKLPEKVINSYFLSDITSEDFLVDPLTILSFDHNSVVPYMKNINYFIELAENILRAYAQYNEDGQEESGYQQDQVTQSIEEYFNRTNKYIKNGNHSDAYSNYMTLQSLYIALKKSKNMILDSTIRELMSRIITIASTDNHGSLLFGFDQLIQYFQTNDWVNDANLFCDLFFGQSTCWNIFSNMFSQSAKESKFLPPIFRIHNAFEHRIHRRRAELQNLNKEITISTSKDEIYIDQDKKMKARELCNYIEIYVRFIKNSVIRNMIFKKRANVEKVLSKIIHVCELDISKLFRVNPVTLASEVSHKRLIQLYSVLTDFAFDAFLCFTQLPYESELLPACTEALIKFIMKIWINLDTIKYYERQDQMYKMVHLLQGLLSLIPLCETSHVKTAVNIIAAQQIPDTYQSINISKESIFSRTMKSLLLQEKDLKEGYNFLGDIQFVITTWINQLYAHNYNYSCPKNYEVTPLTKKSMMVIYFPEAAFKIFSECAPKGSSKYTSAFKSFESNCEKAVLTFPEKYLEYSTALKIYTSQDIATSEPTPKEFKEYLHLWHCFDLGISKYLCRNYDNCDTLHYLSLQFLNYASRDSLLFLSSELFQALRTYTDGKVENFLVKISTKWPSLTHRIIWMAEVETEPSEDDKDRKVPLDREDILPETCQRIIDRILSTIRKHEKILFQTESGFFEDVTAISGIMKPSMSKDEKRAIIKDNLIRINRIVQSRTSGYQSNQNNQHNEDVPEWIPNAGNEEIAEYLKSLYLPTNPSCKVVSIVETSGAPMQSAAKCPFRVTFNVVEEAPNKKVKEEEKVADDMSIISEGKLTQINSIIGRQGRESVNSDFSSINERWRNDEDQIFSSHKNFRKIMTFNRKHSVSSFMAKNNENSRGGMVNHSTKNVVMNNIVVPQNKTKLNKRNTSNIQKVSCIFKVFDDVRQDILAIRIVKLFKEIFETFELDLHLFPYNVLCNRTGEKRNIGGIIECVPNTHSRDELGKDYDVNMYQYFVEKFGSEDSQGFKKAQQNFIRSLAGYSVFSYIVQPKDRHNGNIMIDEIGNLVHIDFGFIFDWSPGGDMRFESADFKFTKEMIMILGENKNSKAYQLFVSKAIQGYLAIRKFAKQIIDMVFFNLHSGLPCFKTKSMKLLTKRFRLDLNECQAAQHYRKIINNAHAKWTTKVYDQIQYLQNKISY
ncbi:unnamed protein product [Moneuplotes crassus]|uniref:PI3K/PI4K catalytic domain-containing protein n=1 Tax=Euplotes crassus TaxID=5936 RepID=A0AAD1UU26_EUPCR|nr:unnamed protein product [Moneuplotes crassus]